MSAPFLHFLALKSDCSPGIKSRWQPPLLPTGAAQRQSSPVVTRVTNSFPILLTCKLASTGLLERLPYSCVRAFNHPWRPTLPLERGLPSHTRDHFWLSSRPAGCAQSATQHPSPRQHDAPACCLHSVLMRRPSLLSLTPSCSHCYRRFSFLLPLTRIG